jgi:Lon protease-like protein
MNAATAFPLPLFPLNTVLFPGMPLPLHIFEERYKLMVNECIRDHKPFGVVLIKSGVEIGAQSAPHLIGTTARIISLERLAEGRLNLETVGEDRFRVLELRQDRPYLWAMVEVFPMADSDALSAHSLAQRLRPWVTQYMSLLAQAAEAPFDAARLPAEPLALAYLAAIVLQTPMVAKQELLVAPGLKELLIQERKIYRNEIAILKTLLQRVPSEDHPFSSS